jgi:hypothetical protein
MESPPQFGEIQSFLKSVSTTKISKIPRLRTEDDVKWKTIQYDSCWKFTPHAD